MISETSGSGFSVLDGVGLVAGAAVASVHLRGVLDESLWGPGWVILLGTFGWVGLTAAGPFLYLLRRFARGLPAYPKIGDRLWALLGLPWLVTALIQTASPPQVPATPLDVFPASLLLIGLGIESMIALGVVWTTWVMVDPEQASATFAGPWTNQVGLLLAITWPIQFGVGLVVIG